MKYFTMDEFTRSAAAAANNIDNTIMSDRIRDNINALVDNVLDPLRELYKKPIRINSGFRRHELNTLVNGAKNSAHVQGQAADITAGSKAENQKLFETAIARNIPFDQLIDESDYKWLHISYKTDNTNRKQILHLA